MSFAPRYQSNNCAGFAMILEVSKDMPLPSPPSSMQPRLPAAALPPPVTGNMMLQTSHMFQEPPAMQQSQPEGQPDAASTNNGRRKRKPAATTDGYVMNNESTGRGWTKEHDQKLRAAVATEGPRNWKAISEEIFKGAFTDTQCLNRWYKVLRPGLVKGPWTKEEDDVIIQCMTTGITKWSEIADRIPGRLGKQCRERWLNHLDPNLKKGEWSKEEDAILLDAQAKWGNAWTRIADLLPGRSENAVKNRWNSASHTRSRCARVSAESSMPELSEHHERDAVRDYCNGFQDGDNLADSLPRIVCLLQSSWPHYRELDTSNASRLNHRLHAMLDDEAQRLPRHAPIHRAIMRRRTKFQMVGEEQDPMAAHTNNGPAAAVPPPLPPKPSRMQAPEPGRRLENRGCSDAMDVDDGACSSFTPHHSTLQPLGQSFQRTSDTRMGPHYASQGARMMMDARPRASEQHGSLHSHAPMSFGGRMGEGAFRPHVRNVSEEERSGVVSMAVSQHGSGAPPSSSAKRPGNKAKRSRTVEGREGFGPSRGERTHHEDGEHDGSVSSLSSLSTAEEDEDGVVRRQVPRGFKRRTGKEAQDKAQAGHKQPQQGQPQQARVPPAGAEAAQGHKTRLRDVISLLFSAMRTEHDHRKRGLYQDALDAATQELPAMVNFVEGALGTLNLELPADRSFLLESMLTATQRGIFR